MKCIRIAEFGGPNVLQFVKNSEIPKAVGKQVNKFYFVCSTLSICLLKLIFHVHSILLIFHIMMNLDFVCNLEIWLIRP